MDQYLKDSPSDYNLYQENSSNKNEQQPSGSIDFNANFDEGDLYNDKNNQANFTNDPFTEASGNNQQNNFSLNIEQPYHSQIDDVQFPGIPGTEFISNTDDYSTSVNNEPFLDELDNLNYPTETQNHIGQGSPYNTGLINPSNNLDELISPQNYNNDNNHQFLDSQYFSPPQAQRLNFNSFQPSNSALSPDASRHGSVSIPVQTTNNFSGGSYLSPQTNSFMSPNGTSFNNSYDTLTSPNYESYLNSPPQHGMHQRNISANLISSSIPNTTNNYLSPSNNSNMLGTSAPNQSDQSYNSVNDDAPSRELTKEEKLKRRKKFHNEVERRRRDLIKTRIKELSQLVPPSLLNPQLVAVQTLKNSKLNTEEINDLLASVKVKESKPNKNTILNKSVVYVKHLQYVIQEQERARAELELKLQSLQLNDSPEAKTNANFMEDFNQAQSQFIKEDENFDPDEFFSEIITGNEQSNDKISF